MKTTAFVFPGQGSQQVGMLQALSQRFSLINSLFDRASNCLGYDLGEIVKHGPAEKLNQTIYTQPALFVAGIAMWQLWRAEGGAPPQLMAGHSLGEYTALVAAEAMAFDDAVKLVSKRASFMQQAVPTGQGAMAACVLLSAEKIEQICQQVAQGQVVEIANFNEKNQTVIAGHTEAVDRAIVMAKQAGAKLAKRLAVSVPSHCSLMKPAAEKLAEQLATVTINTPNIKVISNVDAKVHSEVDEIRHALVRQVYQPVRWIETIEKMVTQGVDIIVECGPGKILTGLNRRIAKQQQSVAMNDIDSVQTLLKEQGVEL